MKEGNKNNSLEEPLSAAGHSRRDMLKYGSAAAFGAIVGSGALLGHVSRAHAQEKNIALAGHVSNTSALGSHTGELDPNEPLNILIVNYDGGTLLDFAGPSEIFHRIPNTNVRYASLHGGSVILEFGVVYGKTEGLADIEKTDLILVPGGSNLSAPTQPEYLKQIRRLAPRAYKRKRPGFCCALYNCRHRQIPISRRNSFSRKSAVSWDNVVLSITVLNA